MQVKYPWPERGWTIYSGQRVAKTAREGCLLDLAAKQLSDPSPKTVYAS